MRPSYSPLLAGLAALLISPSAWARPTFLARADRTQVTLGAPVVLEVTLTIAGDRLERFRPPSFAGFRVISQLRNRTGGSYVWRYELSPTRKGRLTIGPARARAGGRDLHTAPIDVTVHPGDYLPGGATARERTPPGTPSPPSPPVPEPGAQRSFLRAVADRTRVHVGEQLVIEWRLYLTDRQARYQAVSPPNTDGFWSEELALPRNQGRPALTERLEDGRLYLVATLSRKALFPLHPGKLTVRPFTAEIAQADFSGRTLRTDRVEGPAVEVEARPLPRANRPEGFDPANVGRFVIDARVDRHEVGVGEPITFVVTVSGQGNVRQVSLPRLEPLPGWKSHAPRVAVRIEHQDGIAGSKTLEQLLLPERPGPTTLPALAFHFFDPVEGRYSTRTTRPLQLEVRGDGQPPGPSQPSGPAAAAGLENVLAAEILPPRRRPLLRRTPEDPLHRWRLIVWGALAAPVLLGLTVALGKLRRRRGDRIFSPGIRRRIRQHLRAAEAHLRAGRAAAGRVEVDRVLHEALGARLGVPTAGLAREELRARMAAAGLDAGLVESTLAELDACDGARFAPTEESAQGVRAAVDRAAVLSRRVLEGAG
jgi:hypothetical protein